MVCLLRIEEIEMETKVKDVARRIPSIIGMKIDFHLQRTGLYDTLALYQFTISPVI